MSPAIEFALRTILIGIPVVMDLWARSPTLLPALLIGIVTVVAPLFILQPAMGAGVASSRTPTPVFNCIKSLVTHTVYGVGLYLAAPATASTIPAR